MNSYKNFSIRGLDSVIYSWSSKQPNTHIFQYNIASETAEDESEGCEWVNLKKIQQSSKN